MRRHGGFLVGSLIILFAFAVAACAVHIAPSAIGGSRADGTVVEAYHYGLFQKPVVDWDAARADARARCAAWGYSDAMPFGSAQTTCTQWDQNLGCVHFQVNVPYQCVTRTAEPSVSGPRNGGQPLRADQLRSTSDNTVSATTEPGDLGRGSTDTQPSWKTAVVRITSGRSVGSGFFVTEDMVATNAHVIRGSENVLVSFSGGGEQSAGFVVYKDSELDFALVRAQMKSTPLPLRETPLMDGEGVMAVGFPQGRAVVAGSTGTVRKIVECCIEHDALIAAGSSGGPLLDANSHVIGINTALVKAKGDRKNETDRTWALKMSYVLESLARVASSGRDAAPPAEAPDAAQQRKLAKLAALLKAGKISTEQYDQYRAAVLHGNSVPLVDN